MAPCKKQKKRKKKGHVWTSNKPFGPSVILLSGGFLAGFGVGTAVRKLGAPTLLKGLIWKWIFDICWKSVILRGKTNLPTSY